MAYMRSLSKRLAPPLGLRKKLAWLHGREVPVREPATQPGKLAYISQQLPLSYIWRKRLRHPDITIFRRMLPLLAGHNLTSVDSSKKPPFETFIQDKMIKRPSQWQLPTELPLPFHQIQGNICGPINPLSNSFRYFLVLIDVSRSHLEVALLTTSQEPCIFQNYCNSNTL